MFVFIDRVDQMEIITTIFTEVMAIKPKTSLDDRGFFLETYQSTRFDRLGIKEKFVQDNHSRSKKNVIRGLHFQSRRPQAQLVTILRGEVFDVVVDVRLGSSTFGQWYGIKLSEEGISQIFMGAGFAHGFCVLSEWADIYYKVTQEYDANDEMGLSWCDPSVGIDWPINNPIIKDRDMAFPLLSEIKVDLLPIYTSFA